MTARAFQTALVPRYMQRERVRGIVSIRVRPRQICLGRMACAQRPAASRRFCGPYDLRRRCVPQGCCAG